MKRQVFYSFHYGKDVMRVQQIRQICVLEGNTPVSANEWEQVKRSGDRAIENWIDNALKYRSCVIVLIGEDTASRKWVQYEIKKAWADGKALMGIYIHNIRDPRYGTCNQGSNPFSNFTLADKNFADIVPCHNPRSWDAYGDIRENVDRWIEEAIAVRNRY
ncbi:MAG: TIR domain-containing protein [Lachnospiraceae bacterium]|nr:TIR domain-containing protein [Lachnospiraceae bacterium]